MARVAVAQNSFNAGEWSPLLYGRTDLDRYKSAVDVCLNAIALVQGPWTRRPGFAYLHNCRDHAVSSRLVPFRHDSGNNYVLEFGNSVMRVFVAQGITVNTPQSLTTITKANPAVATKVAHGYTDGTRIIISDVVGMHQVNGSEFIVANKTADTFELTDINGTAIDSTNYGTYTSGNVSSILELATPYATADLPDLRFTQSSDALYIFHPSYEPRILTRTSATSWTLSFFTATDGPYLSVNTTSTTMSPGAATGTTTLTASAITGINDNTGFQSGDVGRLMRLQQGTTWGWCEILTVTSTTVATVAIYDTLTNTNAKTNWRLGVWSDTTGWPSCGTFGEDRLWVGGVTSYPQRLDASNTGEYTNFAPSALDGTVGDANSISFPLNASDLHEVLWVKSVDKGIAAGTTSGEWLMRAGSSTAEAITPSNATATPSSFHGSADMEPVAIGSSVVFPQRGAKVLREFQYNFEADGFTAPELSLLAEHIMRPSITEMVPQRIPQTIIWSVRSDGVLLGFTYEAQQSVTAWHRHIIGGYSDASALTAAKVESIALVPSADGTRDELYAVTNRYIGGGTKRYIEYMTKFWEQGDDQEDAVHLDSAWTQIETAATTVVDNLIHLEGQTVSVYADGKAHPDRLVSNGEITLTQTAAVVTVGYPFNSDGSTMPPDAGSTNGSAIGKIKKVSKVGFWLLDTLGLKYGRDADNLTELLVREWGDAYGTATPLFTGAKRVRFEGTHDLLGQVYWRCDGPFPATVMAISTDLDVSDDS